MTDPYRQGGPYYVPWLSTGRISFEYTDAHGDAQRREALVNPTTLSETVEPQYSRRPVLGLSHEITQYIRTSSRTISFDLWYNWHIYLQRNDFKPNEHPLAFRNYFAALTVPLAPTKAPPIVTVDWPGMELSFNGVNSSYSVRYERCSNTGVPIEYSISLSFIEVLGDTPMTAAGVRLAGFGQNGLARGEDNR